MAACVCVCVCACACACVCVCVWEGGIRLLVFLWSELYAFVIIVVVIGVNMERG